MASSMIRPVSVLAGVLLFNFLFWQEKMGINTLLFTLFYLAGLWVLFPDGRRSTGFRITAGGTLLCAVMVVWHNSGAAKFACGLSAMCAAGFAQEGHLRLLLYAFWQYCRGWSQAPGHLLADLDIGGMAGNRYRLQLGRTIRLALAPLAVAVVFYFLYYIANEPFAALADAFWRQIGGLFSFDISIPHLLFVVFGFFLVGAAFWHNTTQLAETDGKQSDALMRLRPKQRGRLLEPTGMLGLKQEYRQSLLLLIMLNGLLLIVNATDVRYVWFGFDAAAQQNLMDYVHAGAYVLIASILLAMGVLFHIFRKNLHFFPDSRPLKTAAALWLVQNGVLALSVGLRNWRYIDYNGLAYKRIGVAFFLGLVFFGLLTLWVKISGQRTMFWLWRQNGWALYALLLFNACLNWDVLITRYNLSGRPKGMIDVYYMLYTMSDKNLFLLEGRVEAIAPKAMYPSLSAEAIRQGVETKRRHFDTEHRDETWKSWNAADARNRR